MMLKNTSTVVLRASRNKLTRIWRLSLLMMGPQTHVQRCVMSGQDAIPASRLFIKKTRVLDWLAIVVLMRLGANTFALLTVMILSIPILLNALLVSPCEMNLMSLCLECVLFRMTALPCFLRLCHVALSEFLPALKYRRGFCLS